MYDIQLNDTIGMIDTIVCNDTITILCHYDHVHIVWNDTITILYNYDHVHIVWNETISR